MSSPGTSPDGLAQFPAIPYGRAYFKGIRLEGCVYVDKTRFLHALEQERFVFFIRPRRFGKTCWLSMLESYYDRNQAEDFDRVFGGLDIARQPTSNRGRYVVVRFNFSTFGSDPARLEREFDEYCRRHVRDAVEDHPDLFNDAAFDRIQAPPTINGQLDELFLHARREGIPLYVLIDEYDNFANTILAGEGAEAYHAFTHGGGFYRSFFATLKAGTENGSVERLFVTGVSPVTMDDVTSGFNIGTNLSLRAEFNEMLGLTEGEVRRMLETYRDLGVFDQDIETALGTMREWYNGYRFSEEADGIVYNTDMVLHYVKHSVPNKAGPRQLIDTNVRIDYGKLRHLLLTERQLNGNFDLLRRVIAEGRADSDIVESFPQARLTDPENFISLLHYFGLLSIRDVVAGVPRLGIPNQTVRRLMYKLPARSLRRRGSVLDEPRGVRPAHAADGPGRRLAAGRRAAVPGGGGAHRHPRLHPGRADPARIPGGVPERIRVLRVPHGAGAGEGLRGHHAGAARRALSGHAVRLRDRAEVPEPRSRHGGTGDGGGR